MYQQIWRQNYSPLLKMKWKNLSNSKVSKFSVEASLRSSAKLEIMSQKLMELYEHQLFHGIKTKDEAKALWKAKINESGNPEASIWFGLETQDGILSCIYGSSYFNYDEQLRGHCSITGVILQWLSIPSVARNMVERKMPGTLYFLQFCLVFLSCFLEKNRRFSLKNLQF